MVSIYISLVIQLHSGQLHVGLGISFTDIKICVTNSALTPSEQYRRLLCSLRQRSAMMPCHTLPSYWDNLDFSSYLLLYKYTR